MEQLEFYAAKDEVAVIGRGAHCTIDIKELPQLIKKRTADEIRKVSRFHAVVAWDSENLVFRLITLGMNGVRLNNVPYYPELDAKAPQFASETFCVCYKCCPAYQRKVEKNELNQPFVDNDLNEFDCLCLKCKPTPLSLRPEVPIESVIEIPSVKLQLKFLGEPELRPPKKRGRKPKSRLDLYISPPPSSPQDSKKTDPPKRKRGRPRKNPEKKELPSMPLVDILVECFTFCGRTGLSLRELCNEISENHVYFRTHPQEQWKHTILKVLEQEPFFILRPKNMFLKRATQWWYNSQLDQNLERSQQYLEFASTQPVRGCRRTEKQYCPTFSSRRTSRSSRSMEID